MSTEKELDRVLDEGLRDNAAFRAWFLSKTTKGSRYPSHVFSRANNPWGKVKLLLPNKATGALEMVAREGETDVLAVFADSNNHRLGIHIENKLASGKFTPFQPEVSAARADFWIDNASYGSYHEWETVLVAPRTFYERNQVDARKFTSFIAHEDIAAYLPVFGQ